MDPTFGRTLSPVGSTHPIIAGPAGTWTQLNTFGTQGHFGTVPVDWTTIASYSTGAAAVITRDWGDGQVIGPAMSVYSTRTSSYHSPT